MKIEHKKLGDEKPSKADVYISSVMTAEPKLPNSPPRPFAFSAHQIYWIAPESSSLAKSGRVCRDADFRGMCIVQDDMPTCWRMTFYFSGRSVALRAARNICNGTQNNAKWLRETMSSVGKLGNFESKLQRFKKWGLGV